MSRRSAWFRDDRGVMRTGVLLACGHTIEATEEDGGMDELDSVGWRTLEAVVKDRVLAHAVRGCAASEEESSG